MRSDLCTLQPCRLMPIHDVHVTTLLISGAQRAREPSVKVKYRLDRLNLSPSTPRSVETKSVFFFDADAENQNQSLKHFF